MSVVIALFLPVLIALGVNDDGNARTQRMWLGCDAKKRCTRQFRLSPLEWVGRIWTTHRPEVVSPLFFESHEWRLDETSQASLSGSKPPKTEKGQRWKVSGEVNPG